MASNSSQLKAKSRVKALVSKTQIDHGEANVYAFSSRIHMDSHGIWHTWHTFFKYSNKIFYLNTVLFEPEVL